MSFEAPHYAQATPTDDNERLPETASIADHYDKLLSNLGFIPICDTAQLTTTTRSLSRQEFDGFMYDYIEHYVSSQPAPNLSRSDTYPFRGILSQVSAIYHDQLTTLQSTGRSDHHLVHFHKELLRTVYDDHMLLQDPIDEDFDRLLLLTGVKDPVLGMPQPVHFTHPSPIYVLSKIDHTLLPLWRSVREGVIA
jgi:hypothetical protein